MHASMSHSTWGEVGVCKHMLNISPHGQITSRAVQSECLSVCYLAHVPKDKSLTNISKCLPMSRSVPTALLKFLAVCHNFVSHRFTTFSTCAEHVGRAVHSARLIIPFRFETKWSHVGLMLDSQVRPWLEYQVHVGLMLDSCWALSGDRCRQQK